MRENVEYNCHFSKQIMTNIKDFLIKDGGQHFRGAKCSQVRDLRQYFGRF